MKQAVILAAGIGRRLGHAAHGSPKCLAKVGDRTILDLQLEILDELEIRSIVVVAGFAIDQIRDTLRDRPDSVVVHNPRFEETNSLYSLWLARDWVAGSFICLNGDVLAHPDIFRRVLAVDSSALAFDSASGQDLEHMKVATDGRYLQAIGKDLKPEAVAGENVGLLQFDARGTMTLFNVASGFVAAGQVNEWAPRAVDAIAGRTRIRCVDIAGLPWVEIDFPEDLEEARNRTWPLIESALTRSLPRGEAQAAKLVGSAPASRQKEAS